MQVAVNKLKRVDSGKLKAFADLIFDGSLLVKGFSVVDGANGLFIGYPSEFKEGKDYKSVYILTEELRKQIEKVVLECYAN